jgi:predicted dehydrogenase
MQISFLVFGCGSYVIGNKYTKPTILPSILTYINAFSIAAKIILVGNSNLSLSRQYQIDSLRLDYSHHSHNLEIEYTTYSQINLDDYRRSHTLAIVATPDTSHYSIVSALVHQCIPTICVKPFVLNTHHYHNLLALSNKYETPILIDFHKRNDPSLRYLYTHLRSTCSIAEIQSIDVFYQQPYTDKHTQTKSNPESNVFQYLGVHFIDLISWLCDATLNTAKFISFGTDRIDCYGTWHTQLHTNFNSLITSSWSGPNLSPFKSEQSIRVKTNCSEIRIDLGYRGVTLLGPDKYQYINPYFSTPVLNPSKLMSLTGYGYNTYHYSFDYLLKHLGILPSISKLSEDGVIPLQGVYDSVYAVELCNNFLSAITS